MAPDVAKKAPKLCKKYTYTEHSKYSQWEKERRARFNDRLEELSRSMPGYSKENPWKKIEIIEQAISNITKRKMEASKSQEEAISGLAREVHQLKSIILQFTKIKKVNADVFKLTSTEIGQTLENLAEQEKENLPPEPPDPEAEESLAFVAKIARSNDHDYIRTTEETPSLEVEGEVVVETAVVDQEEHDEVIVKAAGPTQPLIVDLVAEFDPQPLPSFITFEPTAAVASSLPDAPQLLNLQDLIWPRGLAAVPNVRTVFVNKGSRASLLPSEPLTGVQKLPIPRLKPPKRRSRPKKTRRGTNKTKIKATESESEALESTPVDLPLSEDVTETSSKEISESLEALEAVEEALPLDKDDILQNNEEMEILEETIKEQGERETREKSEKDAKKKEGKRSTVVDKDGEKVVVKKKVDQGKKKSKSSYSIAALCQISVNIGDRPEMANSPGVLSLNSVGTMSPSHTPAPTPTPDPSKTFGMETCGIVIDREENVIEELRTIRPEDVTFETPGPSGDTNMRKTVSPSQNFLTNLPAVSKSDQEDTISVSTKTIQRDIYQVLKDLDKDLNLETETLPEPAAPEVSKPEEPKKMPEPAKETKVVATTVSTVTVSRYLTSCTTTSEAAPPTTSAALSVYDFSASKPDTPPIPLQKARKQEIRKDEVRAMPAYKSPEKKTYTEMQNKPKKSPVDGGKGKEVVAVAGQNQQYQGMEYQQVQSKQYHQASASYQSRHQMYMGSHYPTYQGMGALQQQHPYHHAPHHPYPPDDMKAGSHHSRYSCASHSYLPAPNYHHYPSAPKHYQGQPGWGQQHYPKPRDRGQAHMEMDAAGNSTPAQASGTFTVNQLVNSGQRKSSGAKRSSTAGKGGSAAKVARGEAAKEKEKEDCRKRSGGTRRNKSGGRSTSYSAESLMLPSSAGLVVTAETKEDQTKVKVGPSPSKKEGKMEAMTGSRAQTTNTWANTGDHFGGLQLSSLSPSPASLFPQDLSSLDFPMPMFGPGEGKDYSAVPPSSQTQKTPGKQQAACQRAGTSSVVDWSLNSNILEGGWPLPTITPPGDPMADSMASYNFMSPVPHSHPGFYSCSAPQTGSRQGQGQSYSAHSAANIPVSGYSSSTMVMAKSGATQPFPPSGVSLLYHPQHCNFNMLLQAQTGSLVNFNLSTIFPEINIPAVGHAAPNCQVDWA